VQAQLRHCVTASQPPCVADLPAEAAKGAPRPAEMEVHTALKKLRIVVLGYGTARQKMALE
jgi:hypothetical protein